MSASVGLGGSKGSTKDTSASAANRLGLEFAKETKPLRGDLISIFNEMLQTGGSRLPIFSQAEENSRLAASKTSADTSNSLAQSGLSGTPFGQAIMAQTAQSGNQAAANSRNTMFMQLLQQIQPFVLGQGTQAVAAQTGSVGGNTSSKGSAMGTAGGAKIK
jgi:hypothetical protein